MQLNHYLNFDGQTEAAFNFYKSVFGGEFATFMRYGDLPSDESSVALSDADQQKNHACFTSHQCQHDSDGFGYQ